ncbi:MAG: hypothetical protein AAF499_05025 [Pseudomonadota bacterium]
MSSDGQVDIKTSVIDKPLNTARGQVDVSVGRRAALVSIELLVLLVCCLGILLLWERQHPPELWFAVLVALVLFVCNGVCGTYKHSVYTHHVARLARSALAHGLGGVAMAVPLVVWFEAGMELGYLYGMVIMSFFIANTLRPVLVEVLRAGNRFDQRRQPGSSISVS